MTRRSSGTPSSTSSRPSRTSRALFSPTTSRRVVAVTLRNVGPLRVRAARVEPEGIDESALEDLVRFYAEVNRNGINLHLCAAVRNIRRQRERRRQMCRRRHAPDPRGISLPAQSGSLPMRIALGLEYCGTPFTGWQSQPDGRGVQDALERALAAIAGARVGTIAAGRTDAGVHATMQVVAFDADGARPERRGCAASTRIFRPTSRCSGRSPWPANSTRVTPPRRAATPTCSQPCRCGRRSSPAASAGTIGRSISQRCRGGAGRSSARTIFRLPRRRVPGRSPTKTLSDATIAANGELRAFRFFAPTRFSTT